MSQFYSKKSLETIKGVLQIPFKSIGSQCNASESSDEDEEEDLDDIFSYAGDSDNFVSTRRPKETKVEIKSDDGIRHSCTGRFPLTQVFWRVEVKVANGWLKQAPKYYILNDAQKIRTSNMITIFISECFMREKLPGDIGQAIKACFEAYCKISGEDKNVTFHNVENIFKEYLKQESTRCCLGQQGESNLGKHTVEDHSDYMMNNVINSELGSVVLLAASHPELVATCSELLPYSFTQFLHKLRQSNTINGSSNSSSMIKKMKFIHSKEVEQKVRDAEEMARKRPWEFAFKDVIAKKLKIYGTEARLQAYIQSGYLPKIPQTEKDAMYIYEVLKEDARRNGNMYMELNQMKKSSILKRLNYSITDDTRWESALSYLKDNKVIEREVFNYKENIFLRPNWQAEVDTVQALNNILSQHKVKPLTWDIDLTSPDFSYLQHDDDQVKATQLICQMPITVLSGKGGCGKTTVVTRLLKYLCDREEMRLKEEETSEIIDDSFQLDHSDIHLLDVSLAEKSAQNILLQEINDPEMQNTPGAVSTQRAKPDSQVNQVKVSPLEKFRHELASDLIKILESSKQQDSTELKEFKKEILLTAPTGKAARLLGHKAKLPSVTLHSVIMSWRNFSKTKEPKYDAEDKCWTYSKVKILVVDECSLVSVRLFSTVVNILLNEASLQKIILLGDVRQLPSIEPGEFLKDVFKSFCNITDDGFGLSIELTQNHRSESELIVKNATKISNRLMPTFDPEGSFHLKEISDINDDNERDRAICHLLKNFEDVRSDVDSQFVSFRNAHCKAVNELCSKFYNNHSIEVSGSGRKARFDFQIGDKICFGKNSVVANSRNLILERYLKDYKDFQEAFVKSRQKHEGNRGQSREQKLSKTHLDGQSALDLLTEEEETYYNIMEEIRLIDRRAEDQRDRRHTKENPDEKVKSTDRISDESLIGERSAKLCNGEVFFIMDEIDKIEGDNRVVKYLVLSDRDPELPRVVCVPLKSLRRCCRMKHSWARTIHTYQGSESNTVVYVLGKAIPQNWQHVYTAITRGKKSVYIIGSHSELLKAINRREPLRNTRLGHRLREMIAQYDDLITKSKQEFYSQRLQNSPTSLEDSLSDLSESFIHELDETVAKFIASCSTLKGKPQSAQEDLCASDVNIETNAAVLNAVMHDKVEVQTGLDCSDSDIFSLSSWDGDDADDSNDVTCSQPTQKVNFAASSKATYFAANELDAACRLPHTKRNLSESHFLDLPSSSTSEDLLPTTDHNKDAFTPPRKTNPFGSSAADANGTSPSKKLCVNVLSTPFQDNFRNSLSLKTEQSSVCKKL
ncbi:hypothetical protein Btru_002725 [Bulinus truncatus]|nr:hypothetical protein Btru_002725 [Bulinus truncatus]